MTTDEVIRRAIKSGGPGLSDLIVGAIVRNAMMKIRHHAGVELSEENDRLMEERNATREENARLRDALLKAEEADQQHNNCDECEPCDAPETCVTCFPLFDDARLMRWAALGINRPSHTE